MLTHFAGILFLASVSVADVPSRLFAISHLKGLINELQDGLLDFKKNVTVELNKLEASGRNYHKNETSCLKQISQAHNETRKLLNMMVEGEYSGLETAEASLGNMTLNELNQLWGALAPGGKSEVQVQNEMADYRKTATARVIEAVKACKTSVNTGKKSVNTEKSMV